MFCVEDVKDEFLLCGICIKEFDEEIYILWVFLCFYIFCYLCMKKILKENLMVCLFCKVEYVLLSDGIYVFLKDFIRWNLIEFLKVWKRFFDIFCKDCFDDNIVVDFCKECYIFMCLDCMCVYWRSLVFRIYFIIDIK